jgi:Fungal N-terminal domain of STAND proteins
MDPISIVASIIAIAQAGDRLVQLIPEIRLYFTALEQIDALVDEVSDLRLVLDTTRASASNLPDVYITGLENSLATCNHIVLELERILNSFLDRPPRASGLVQTQVHRMRWMKKKARVERLRQRLRDAKSTLMLQLLSINP